MADSGDDQIAVTRASLEAKASRWRSRLRAGVRGSRRLPAQRAAEAAGAGKDDPVDCSEHARAVSQAEERLEHIRLWQYRVGDQEASEFLGIASRFRAVLEDDLPRTEDLLAIIASPRALVASRSLAPDAESAEQDGDHQLRLLEDAWATRCSTGTMISPATSPPATGHRCTRNPGSTWKLSAS